MFKSLRSTLAVLGAGLILGLAPALVLTTAPAYAAEDISNCLSQGSNLDLENIDSEQCGGDTDTEGGTSEIQRIVRTVINIFSVIVGLVAVIMIIYGGFKYVTSGGDQSNVTSAKQTIMYAIIGLVIVALAQFFVQFVLEQVTGA